MTTAPLVFDPPLRVLVDIVHPAHAHFYRRMIATAQSNFFGGRISPGCIVAEAILLLLLAALFLTTYSLGYFEG